MTFYPKSIKFNTFLPKSIIEKFLNFGCIFVDNS